MTHTTSTMCLPPSQSEYPGFPVIHLCLFGCGLVVNSAPTRQPGLGPHTQRRYSQHLQKTYDQLIPFYCGEPTGSFDLSKVGTILIQEYRKEKSSLSAALEEIILFVVAAISFLPGYSQTFDSQKFQRIIVDDPSMKLLSVIAYCLSSSTLVERILPLTFHIQKPQTKRYAIQSQTPVLPWLAAQSRRQVRLKIWAIH